MIKITAISYNNQTSLDPLYAIFGRSGGTLGRSDSNDFVLPDPKHFVSRIQASVKSDGVKHTITNLSKSAPIFINGKELDYQSEHLIYSGDEIRIGLYILQAEPMFGVVDKNGSIVGQQSEEALEELEEAAMSLMETTNTSPASRKKPSTKADNPLPESTSSEAITKPRKLKQVKPKQAKEPIKESFPLPITAPISEPTTNQVSIDQQALAQAFLKGAGVPHINLSAGLTPEFMETLGKLLSSSIQGTFDLLSTRALIKREVNADITMIMFRNNNPLKFLSDSEAVLMQMLRKKMPGFMGPAEAMEEAYEDLHVHQQGMVAGMHAAIGELLNNLDPQELEHQFKSSSSVDSFMPIVRKARMWDHYNDLFRAINREARRDFQAYFGDAFLTAYAKASDRAKGNKKD